MLYYKELFELEEKHDFSEFLPSFSYGFKETGIAIAFCKNTNTRFSTSYFFDHEHETYEISYKYCPYCGKKILQTTPDYEEGAKEEI